MSRFKWYRRLRGGFWVLVIGVNSDGSAGWLRYKNMKSVSPYFWHLIRSEEDYAR